MSKRAESLLLKRTFSVDADGACVRASVAHEAVALVEQVASDAFCAVCQYKETCIAGVCDNKVQFYKLLSE